MPAEITRATVLYDGPTRGICPLLPRNANSHRTVALAEIGFDRMGSVVVADPVLEVSVIELTAPGKGSGSAMQIC
jgi:aspartate dehydrogenase